MSISQEIIAMCDAKWHQLIRLCLSESRNENGDIDPIVLERMLTVIIGEWND